MSPFRYSLGTSKNKVVRGTRGIERARVAGIRLFFRGAGGIPRVLDSSRFGESCHDLLFLGLIAPVPTTSETKSSSEKRTGNQKQSRPLRDFSPAEGVHGAEHPDVPQQIPVPNLDVKKNGILAEGGWRQSITRSIGRERRANDAVRNGGWVKSGTKRAKGGWGTSCHELQLNIVKL